MTGTERTSCEFLEWGVSFSYSTLRACAEIHHGTGEPPLFDYAGEPLDLDRIVAAKAAIIDRNQHDGDPHCRGCPSLVRRVWPTPSHPIRWLGLTHWIACNLECDYCWLQWASYAPRFQATKMPPRLFDLRPPVRELIDRGWLAPDALIDWGGGGEPTLMPEFDELVVLLDRHGTTQWMHTNGVKLPAAVAERRLDGSRLHVLCSIDAGTPATYRHIKQRDAYATVWHNLRAYRQAGANVTVKYLMTERNCARDELDRFIRDARRHGNPTVLGDIDHRNPESSTAVVDGLAYLEWATESSGLHFAFGETGADSAPEFDIAGRVAESHAHLARSLRHRALLRRPRQWWTRLQRRLMAWSR